MSDLEKSCTHSTSTTIITHLKTPAPPPWIALREVCVRISTLLQIETKKDSHTYLLVQNNNLADVY